MMVPPIPVAEPAKWGRTDIMPDIALGRHIPLPNPMAMINPKNTKGPGEATVNKNKFNAMPMTVTMDPQMIILFTPMRVAYRPEM